jgi:hypothetical protein
MVEHVVEQRVAVQDRHARRSHLPALLLTLGAGLVLWLLMTGTAHAAVAPVETPGPGHGAVSQLLGHTPVAPLTRAARTRQQGAHHVVHDVAHHVVEQTLPAAADPIRKAVRSAQQTSTTVIRTVVEAASATSSASQARGPHGTHDTASTPTGTRTTVHTSAVRTSHHDDLASRHADSPEHSSTPPAPPAPPAPAPGGSGGGSDGGAATSSGPGAAALVEQVQTPHQLASSEHSADARPVLPVEPAYPPGCSPD